MKSLGTILTSFIIQQDDFSVTLIYFNIIFFRSGHSEGLVRMGSSFLTSSEFRFESCAVHLNDKAV